MKRAVLLHATDRGPEDNWFPWLKAKLEAAGYEVWVPALPGNHRPNRQVYGDFLLGSGWDFTDNIVVGRSSGAVEVLNLLMDERCPRIKLGVLAAAWAGGNPMGDWVEPGQFDGLFPPDGFDFDLIKQKADKLAYLHSDNDPYCPLEQAEYLAKQTNAALTLIPGGEHLGDKFIEFPEVWDIIEPLL